MIYLNNVFSANQEEIRYFFKAFNFDELQYIEAYCKTLDYSIQNGIDKDINKPEKEVSNFINRKIYSINHVPKEIEFFIDKLEEYINQANNYFRFNLNYITDLAYIETGESLNPLDWHNDISKQYPHNQRKLSFSLIINDPKEYEGGILEINNGSGNNNIIPPNPPGSLIFFPSFMLHRVTTVTKGVRKSIVGFVGGEPYK